MSPVRRKAVENELIAVLRAARAAALTIKAARTLVAERVDGCSPAELAVAVQSLRYQGKLLWDRLELTPSMALAVSGPSPSPGPGPDDPDDYPGEVNDQAAAEAVPEARRSGSRPSGAATRAAARPVPAPRHESEVARSVREEINDGIARRCRARSTGSVRQPLELKKFGVADMNLTEALSSMLSDDPQSIMRAVSRKHPALWRRVILLGRALGVTPMQALYDALEQGVTALEQAQPQEDLRDVA